MAVISDWRKPHPPETPRQMTLRLLMAQNSERYMAMRLRPFSQAAHDWFCGHAAFLNRLYEAESKD